MATKYEYYTPTPSAELPWGPAYGVNWKGQTFTPSTAHKITSVKLLLYRTGSPGTYTVSIRATSGGSPTGGDLCSGSIDGNTLTTDTGGLWYEITLGAGADLTASVQYAICMRAPDGNSGNAVQSRGRSGDATYAGGTRVYSVNSGVDWGSIGGDDHSFEEWGDPVVTEKTSSDTGSGADALLNRAFMLPETGAGVEALSSRVFGAAEIGSGIEALLLAAALTGAEAGFGIDAYISLLQFYEKFGSDTGTGIDALRARLFAAADTGSALEAVLLINAFLSTDSGLGAELSALMKALLATDLGIGSDRLVAKIESPSREGAIRLPPEGRKISIPSREVYL